MILDTDRDSLAYLLRDQNRWPLGFGSTMGKNEPTKLYCSEQLYEGDRVAFRHGEPSQGGTWQANAQFQVHDVTFRTFLFQAMRVVFEIAPRCPICGTREPHEAEIPKLTQEWRLRRYVLRTCAVCDTSWEQEADA